MGIMTLMATEKEIKKIESRVRTSKVYADWVTRNKGIACLKCDSDKTLELHHIVELYPTLFSLWKVYGESEAVFEHCLAMHEQDRCECIILCDKCHSAAHPARLPLQKTLEAPRIAMWCAIPRNLDFEFSLGTKGRRPGSLGLVSFQTLLGIGWYLINGNVEHRIVEFHRRRFAELIGKKPGTSFNRSLVSALKELENEGFVLGYAIDGNDVEVHMSGDYLTEVEENPWFVALNDIQTSRMSVLALRWFLGLQSNRRTYRIRLCRLAAHLGMSVTTPSAVMRMVKSSMDEIPWAKLSVKRDILEFTISQRGATPVYSLRQILRDTLA